MVERSIASRLQAAKATAGAKGQQRVAQERRAYRDAACRLAVAIRPAPTGWCRGGDRPRTARPSAVGGAWRGPGAARERDGRRRRPARRRRVAVRIRGVRMLVDVDQLATRTMYGRHHLDRFGVAGVLLQWITFGGMKTKSPGWASQGRSSLSPIHSGRLRGARSAPSRSRHDGGHPVQPSAGRIDRPIHSSLAPVSLEDTASKRCSPKVWAVLSSHSAGGMTRTSAMYLPASFMADVLALAGARRRRRHARPRRAREQAELQGRIARLPGAVPL